jgi:hypothetical protein
MPRPHDIGAKPLETIDPDESKSILELAADSTPDPWFRILRPCHYDQHGKAFTPPPKPPRRKPGEPVPPEPEPTLVRQSQFGVKLDFTRPNAKGEWPYGKDLTEARRKEVIEEARAAIVINLIRMKAIEPWHGPLPAARVLVASGAL